MKLPAHLRAVAAFLALSLLRVSAASNPILEREFNQTVRPFVTKYCIGCHSGATPAAGFDLKAYSSMESAVRDYPRWALVRDKLSAGQMPPKPTPTPPAEAVKQVTGWIQAVRSDEISKHAGDPGPVLARRLSNAEYNYSIRDLTGVDMRPTREFPVDPSNMAGFDNSGESLTMSPALLTKYLQAARDVADHLVLKPDGIDFAAHPMLSETDREQYPIQRIVNFYLRQPTDFADYFEAAWRYKYRAALGTPTATLATIAAESKISAKYLSMVWALIEEPAEKAKQEVGPIAKLQSMWRALARDASQLDAVRQQCVEMRQFVTKIRSHTSMQFAAPVVKGLPAGSQPLMNWKLRAFASHRRDSDPANLLSDNVPPPAVPEIPKHPGLHEESAPRWAAISAKARAGDPDLVIPAGERQRYEASFARFASVFPNAFYISERGRYFPDDSEDKGRLLSAGFHNTMGYFRDDTPLMELILDEKGQREINRLWDEFDFIASFTERTWVQYFFNQSGEVQGKGDESGTARPVDHAITDTAVIMGLRDAYLAKALANSKNDPVAPGAMRDHFDRINDTLRSLERMRIAAEPRHLDALVKFASRAYRRPLTKTERDDLIASYHRMRDHDGLSREDSIRDSIASILMSPYFVYRIDLPDTRGQAEMTHGAIRPLSNYEIASRLSYFLWSSLPDSELLRHAALGDLQSRGVVLAQARRMLKDDRIRDFATEFGGNWLDFRRFESYNSVDRARFPNFTSELRESMFEEPIRFLEDVIRNDRPAIDMLYGNYTFVNPVLAKHYNMTEVKGGADSWVRVDDAGRFERGGLLPMAVFLTNTSPGLRTSPVKRGYWIARRVLGEAIPPPPAVVPELPSDESKSDRPLREALAQHRASPVCAGCHARFDAFGLALEGYGPVGEVRTQDLGGRMVDASATFPGDVAGAGFAGIKAFIREHRQNDFVDGLARKLLAYALNRSLQLSDESLIERMKADLVTNGGRFNALIETVVVSPQFLNKRISSASPASVAPLKPGVQSRKGN